MITFTIPDGTNVDLFGRLLFEAGVHTSIIVENGEATFPELEETDRQVILDTWTVYQDRVADRAAVVNAMQANQAFLGVASPTTAQAVGQVKALTQQINALVLMLNERDILE